MQTNAYTVTWITPTGPDQALVTSLPEVDELLSLLRTKQFDEVRAAEGADIPKPFDEWREAYRWRRPE